MSEIQGIIVLSILSLSQMRKPCPEVNDFKMFHSQLSKGSECKPAVSQYSTVAFHKH